MRRVPPIGTFRLVLGAAINSSRTITSARARERCIASRAREECTSASTPRLAVRAPAPAALNGRSTSTSPARPLRDLREHRSATKAAILRSVEISSGPSPSAGRPLCSGSGSVSRSMVRGVDRADAVDHAVVRLAGDRPAALGEPVQQDHLPQWTRAVEALGVVVRCPVAKIRRPSRPPAVARSGRDPRSRRFPPAPNAATKGPRSSGRRAVDGTAAARRGATRRYAAGRRAMGRRRRAATRRPSPRRCACGRSRRPAPARGTSRPGRSADLPPGISVGVKARATRASILGVGATRLYAERRAEASIAPAANPNETGKSGSRARVVPGTRHLVQYMRLIERMLPGAERAAGRFPCRCIREARLPCKPG